MATALRTSASARVTPLTAPLSLIFDKKFPTTAAQAEQSKILIGFGSNQDAQLEFLSDSLVTRGPTLWSLIGSSSCVYANEASVDVHNVMCGPSSTFIVLNPQRYEKANLYACGANDTSQQGFRSPISALNTKLTRVPFFDKFNVESVELYYRHTLFKTPSFKVFCVGGNAGGQLGTNTTFPILQAPVEIRFHNAKQNKLKQVLLASAGELHSIYQTDDLKIWSVGTNNHGELGLANGYLKRMTIARVPTFCKESIVGISCGAKRSWFISTSGKVYFCGFNEKQILQLSHHLEMDLEEQQRLRNYFQSAQIERLKNPEKILDNERIDLPRQVLNKALVKEKIVDIKCGAGNNTVFLSESGMVFLTGNVAKLCLMKPTLDEEVQEPLEPTDITQVPQEYFNDEKVTQITCSGNNVAFLTDKGNAYIGGENHYGQCGHLVGQFTRKLRPITKASLPVHTVREQKGSDINILRYSCKVLKIAIGENHTVILAKPQLLEVIPESIATPPPIIPPPTLPAPSKHIVLPPPSPVASAVISPVSPKTPVTSKIKSGLSSKESTPVSGSEPKTPITSVSSIVQASPSTVVTVQQAPLTPPPQTTQKEVSTPIDQKKLELPEPTKVEKSETPAKPQAPEAEAVSIKAEKEAKEKEKEQEKSKEKEPETKVEKEEPSKEKAADKEKQKEKEPEKKEEKDDDEEDDEEMAPTSDEEMEEASAADGSKKKKLEFPSNETIEKKAGHLFPPEAPESQRKFYTHLYGWMLARKKKLPDKIPCMGYKTLDLFNLYKEITKRGGFDHVVNQMTGTTDGLWSKIHKKLSNFRPSITNACSRLKKYYKKFLYDYEKDNFTPGKVPSAEEMEEDEDKENSSAEEDVKTDEKKPKANGSASSSTSTTNDEELPSKRLSTRNNPAVLKQIRIKIPSISDRRLIAQIYDTPTGRAFCQTIPITSQVITFGNLFYFSNFADLSSDPEVVREKSIHAKNVIEKGEIAYWMTGNSMIVGYGKTPASKNDECRLVDKCVVCGKIVDPNNIEEVVQILGNIKNEVSIIVEAVPSGEMVPVAENGSLSDESSSPERKRKRAANQSPSEKEKKKRKMTASSVSSGSRSPLDPNYHFLTIKWKFDKDMEADSRLIKLQISKLDKAPEATKLHKGYAFDRTTEQGCISAKDVIKFLLKDGVDVDSISEIRFIDEDDGEIDLYGWVLLRHSFKYPLSDRTVLRLRLQSGSKPSLPASIMSHLTEPELQEINALIPLPQK